MKREELSKLAATGCRWAALATIVLAPTQWDFHLQGLHLSLIEPLVLFAGACWLVKVMSQREWWRMPWPLPWQVVAFVLPALLSLYAVEREGAGDALREAVQLLEYFVIGYILYDDLLRHQPQRLRGVINLVLGVTALIVLLALGQFLLGSGDPVRGVVGTFKSRNVLAGWLAMTLPVLFGVALYATGPWVRAGLWLLLACGLLVNLSAASLGSVLGVMLLIAATRGWRTFAMAVLAVTLWVTVVTEHVGNFRDPDTGTRVTSQQVLFRSTALYTPDGQPERRYPQWQSAVEMMLTHPWLGEGIGSYQRRVEQYTGTKPMPTGPSEPDIQNLYLVIGSTMGLPALLGFLALLLVPAFQAGAAAPRHAGWRRGFVYGVSGGIAAFAITAIWHPLLVRGIGLHLVLLLVVAGLLAEWSKDRSSREGRDDEPARRPDDAHGSGQHRQHRRRWRSPEQPGRLSGNGGRR
ncbi:MAG: O-antigen ligase family protein [bacterium]